MKEVVLLLVASMNIAITNSKYLLVKLEDTKYPMIAQRSNAYRNSQGKNVA